MKKGIIIVLVILVVGAGLWYTLSNQSQNKEASNKDGEAVAIVNGEKIAKADLEAQFAQAKQMYSQQNLNDQQKQQLKDQLLDQLIGSILLKQEAKKQGVTIDQGEIDSQMDQMIQSLGGEEAFNKQLQQSGLTREELKTRMKEQLVVQEYINSEISEGELSVTDEELKSYYDQMRAIQQGGGTQTPSFEEMEDTQKDQMRSQLKQQKRSTQTQQLIEKLKKDANIQKLNQE